MNHSIESVSPPSHTPGPFIPKQVPAAYMLERMAAKFPDMPDAMMAVVVDSTQKKALAVCGPANNQEIVDNAYLFAAAPDLLQAAKLALVSVEEWWTEIKGEGDVEDERARCITWLKDAIAKAEAKP
jgi:hypothetical protein